jgi:hypothetical protein
MRSPLYNSFIHPPIPLGAHLVTDRGLYTHHGIYIGNSTVIHYSGLANGIRSGPVEKIAVEDFGGPSGFWIQEYENPQFSGSAIVTRAKSRLGEDEYNVQTNNCEHFCAWAITGVPASAQVSRAVKAAKLVTSMLSTRANLALSVVLRVQQLNGKIRNHRLKLNPH